MPSRPMIPTSAVEPFSIVETTEIMAVSGK
jgi:hypothetical protein